MRRDGSCEGTTSPPPLWTFDMFEPGMSFGSVSVTIDEERVALWERIYDSPGTPSPDRVPQGLIVTSMMEAYMKALERRPPGNIHAGQTLRFTGHAVPPGATLSIAFDCRATMVKADRRWVTFGVSIDNDAIATGEILSLWAR